MASSCPLTAVRRTRSFCIGRATEGRSFYVQIKDQFRPTWRSYAGPPQQRRISVPVDSDMNADKYQSAGRHQTIRRQTSESSIPDSRRVQAPSAPRFKVLPGQVMQYCCRRGGGCLLAPIYAAYRRLPGTTTTLSRGRRLRSPERSEHNLFTQPAAEPHPFPLNPGRLCRLSL
jgi:hypothetical protein